MTLFTTFINLMGCDLERMGTTPVLESMKWLKNCRIDQQFLF